jgi:class 3 adenylate cyclase
VREGNAEARQSFKDVTVAYVNFSGFESLPAELGETDSMALLSDVVAACDEAAEQYGVEKVRSIGSSYLAVSGLSVERPDHTALMVQFATEVVRIVKRFNADVELAWWRRSASMPVPSSAASSADASSSTISGATP